VSEEQEAVSEEQEAVSEEQEAVSEEQEAVSEAIQAEAAQAEVLVAGPGPASGLESVPDRVSAW
jgi:hypothetical protein